MLQIESLISTGRGGGSKKLSSAFRMVYEVFTGWMTRETMDDKLWNQRQWLGGQKKAMATKWPRHQGSWKDSYRQAGLFPASPRGIAPSKSPVLCVQLFRRCVKDKCWIWTPILFQRFTSGTCFTARLQFVRHFVLKQFFNGEKVWPSTLAWWRRLSPLPGRSVFTFLADGI